MPLFTQQSEIIQDPDARSVLDRASAIAKSTKSIQADFELVIEDRKEKTTNRSTGNLVIKHEKYKINASGSTVFFNGKTMWTFIADNNEVTISEPDNNNNDFLSNPAKIFTLYNRDFKYRYVRETTLKGLKFHEIDLYPNNLNQPYSRIKIFVGFKSELPEIISSIGKDGVDYTVNLGNIQLDKEISDAVFTFDPSRFKKVDVIDMRGVK
jgi:outer membrane lipoprotein-sorting protein